MKTVVVTGLDGFKEINDQFGHATGDLAPREATNSCCCWRTRNRQP